MLLSRSHHVGLLAIFLTALPGLAQATDGMNPIAYETRAAGMGGADTALGETALAMTNNPAGMAFIKKARLDFNLTTLLPFLTLEDQVTMGGVVPINDGLKSEFAIFPLFGIAYARPIRSVPGLAVAIGAFVQGGMGADFRNAKTFVDDNPNSPVSGPPAEGRYDMHSQVMYVKIAPTVAYRWRWLAVGLSAHIGMAQMEFYHHGMQFPEPDGDHMFGAHKMAFESGFAFGVGGRAGIQLSFLDDNLRFGASYMMKAQPHFAGTMNVATIPGNPSWDASTDDFGWAQEANFGIAGRLLDKRLTLALDVKWVNWSAAVDVVTFESDDLPRTPKGLEQFPFFMRWRDTVVLAVGAEYELIKRFLALRLGYNYGSAPTTPVGVNPMFPPVTEHHITAGVGLARLWKGLSLNFAFEAALPGKVTSNTANQMAYEPSNPPFQHINGYQVAVQMMQISAYFGLSYQFE